MFKMNLPDDFPSVALPDPIFPPTLAFSMGREASRRAKYWTGEGYYIPDSCDCHDRVSFEFEFIKPIKNKNQCSFRTDKIMKLFR